jgi:hypothetical protein
MRQGPWDVATYLVTFGLAGGAVFRNVLFFTALDLTYSAQMTDAVPEALVGDVLIRGVLTLLDRGEIATIVALHGGARREAG